MILLLLLSIILIHGAWGYPKGAPDGACMFMTPSHGAPPQQTTPPYKVIVSSNCYTPGQTYQVTIDGTESNTRFVGFLMVAKQGIDEYVGQFEAIKDKTQLRCSGKDKRGVTHTLALHEELEAVETMSIVHNWKAPETDIGEVCIKATVVRVKTTFWVGITTCLPVCSGPPVTTPPPDDCENLLSKSNKATVTITNRKGKTKKIKIKKCSKLKKSKFTPLCSPDALGGEGNVCCKFCDGMCVDSLTWKTSNMNCEDCTCQQINDADLMDKCCDKNWNGIGADGKTYKCREMCCESCQS